MSAPGSAAPAAPDPVPPPAPVPAAIPIALLACAAFASGAGMRLLDPLLPMVAAEFGARLADVAWVVSGFALSYGLGQVAVGPLGDRFGKLSVVTLALFLYAAGLGACAFAGTLPALVALRSLSGAFAGALFPLLMAHLGDTVPYAERQATIGRFLTGMVMAQLLTGPLAGVVGQAFGWRAVFLLLAAVALLVGALFWRGLARAGVRRRRADAGATLGLGAFLRLVRHPPTRLLLLVTAADGFLLFGGAFPFIGSYLIEDFGLPPWHAGLVVAGFGVGALAYTRLAAVLVRRLGERRLNALGGLGLALGLAALAGARGWPVVAAAQAVFGLSFFCFHGVLQARATEALPEARATAVSAFAMVLFLGQSLGSVCFGALMGAAGYGAGFAVAAALTAALTLATRATVLARPPA